jgi:hypothetical protein
MATTAKTAKAAYRVDVVPNIDWTWENPHGGNGPETREQYKANEVIDKGRTVPYEEYVQYWGNPARHVACGVILERQCPCCHSWVDAGSLWGIDLMDDSPETGDIDAGPFYLGTDGRQPTGSLADVAAELMAEDAHACGMTLPAVVTDNLKSDAGAS